MIHEARNNMFNKKPIPKKSTKNKTIDMIKDGIDNGIIAKYTSLKRPI